MGYISILNCYEFLLLCECVLLCTDRYARVKWGNRSSNSKSLYLKGHTISVNLKSVQRCFKKHYHVHRSLRKC